MSQLNFRKGKQLGKKQCSFDPGSVLSQSVYFFHCIIGSCLPLMIDASRSFQKSQLTLIHIHWRMWRWDKQDSCLLKVYNLEKKQMLAKWNSATAFPSPMLHWCIIDKIVTYLKVRLIIWNTYIYTYVFQYIFSIYMYVFHYICVCISLYIYSEMTTTIKSINLSPHILFSVFLCENFQDLVS